MKLTANSLSLMRGSNLAVEEVSTELAQGQITAICGPNGAGKSSLLMGLAGLLEPASGEVRLGTNALLSLGAQERAKQIGYLPQGADIAWDVSVESLVRLGRWAHRDRGNEAVEAAITTLDLAQLRNRPASQLSGGEQARALLARVLAGEPDWILADEPLAALDLAHQLRLLKHLRTAADAGAGVVLVLHDLSLAMNHADRVLVMHQGRLATDGSPSEALSAKIIAHCWGVDAQWIGDDGARALITGKKGAGPV